jgi:hypothetical protein
MTTVSPSTSQVSVTGSPGEISRGETSKVWIATDVAGLGSGGGDATASGVDVAAGVDITAVVVGATSVAVGVG